MRVKLETLVQDYGDKLVDSKIQPDDTPKTKTVTKDDPAKVQRPVTQSSTPAR